MKIAPEVTVVEVGLFVAASAALVWVSWPSLRAPRSHGFYRFFAWEALLILFLCNMRQWFEAYASARQLVSWGLLLIKRPSWVGALLALAATAFLVATVRREERENLRYFGADHEAYIARTRMFTPRVL